MLLKILDSEVELMRNSLMLSADIKILGIIIENGNKAISLMIKPKSRIKNRFRSFVYPQIKILWYLNFLKILADNTLTNKYLCKFSR